ncbi:MAG: YjgP/YjgQ family permease [Oscillatoriales cyanobacterium SM2_2_1]|nr:YjgP/YjgQ family permease [Oscillatoriales cyanobacterium SM2_2_1]
MDRYLGTQMAPPFLFGVGAFSSIILAIGSLFELVRLVTDSGLSVWVALQIFLLQIPGFMVYSFPMSVLLATMLSFSRLSADGELTALRSCGVSVVRLLIPVILLSFLVSMLTFAFNEAIVPAANWQARSLLRISLNQDAPQFKDRDIIYQQYGDIVQEDNSTAQGLVRSFYARRFNGQRMEGVTVIDFSQGRVQQILVADSAIWLPQENVWQFRLGTTYLVSPDGNYRSILRFEQQNLQLPRSPLDLAQETRGTEEMNISELSRYIALVQQTGNTKEVTRLEVRLQQKYALPFICMVFALIGSPLGMRPQRSSTAVGFGVSVLIIFGYYLLLFISGALGQVGAVPAVAAAWIPNAICAGIGLFLLSRVE